MVKLDTSSYVPKETPFKGGSVLGHFYCCPKCIIGSCCVTNNVSKSDSSGVEIFLSVLPKKLTFSHFVRDIWARDISLFHWMNVLTESRSTMVIDTIASFHATRIVETMADNDNGERIGTQHQSLAKIGKRRLHKDQERTVNRRSRQNSQSASFLPLCLLLVVYSADRYPPYTQAQSTCDFLNDSCNYKFDKECDATDLLPQCLNGDCFDCDVALGLSYDCASCVAAGYYWCPADALCQSEARGAQFWTFAPDKVPGCPASSDWQTTCEAASPDNFFTDPLYDAMKWSFDLINVQEVWQQGITGAGIHVRVNDDGVDANHKEFTANFDFEHSCESYLPTNPTEDNHGTACASIIGAIKNNGECSVGLAPDVTISACNGPPDLEAATELFMNHLEVVDVISNSWGPLPCTEIKQQLQQQDTIKQLTCPFSSDHPESPCGECGATFAQVLTPDCEEAIKDYCSDKYELDPIACGEYLDLYVSCQFHSLSPTNEEGFAKVIQEGRGGKGVIITFAGGVRKTVWCTGLAPMKSLVLSHEECPLYIIPL